MKMWIARDKQGMLAIFEDKPTYSHKNGDIWLTADFPFYIDKNKFPDVTFENSPQEVELVIKSQNKVTECYNCHEVIKFTENDVIDGWYVKCPYCGEEISILL